MSRRRACTFFSAFCLALVVSTATVARAQTVQPCNSAGREAREATSALQTFSKNVDALAPDADVTPLVAELAKIASGPCFAILPERDVTFDSTLALRTFWRAGGRDAFEHVLRFDAPGLRRAVAMPTPRRTLTLETAPNHPLASTLLCSVRDGRCDDTAEWRRRAEVSFEKIEEARRAGHARPSLAECESRANAEPAPNRYATWRTCFGRTVRAKTMLPLGGFRAPHEGWLVVRGRRGHHMFCDELRAYDLATGAAYVAQSCSGLALEGDGSVNVARTDDNRKLRVRVGQLDVHVLREATWAIALANDAQPGVVESASTAPIPSNIAIVLPTDTLSSIALGTISTSSALTTLDWSWSLRGSIVTHGHLRWPDHPDKAAFAHAVSLLKRAEDTLREGCAPSRLPSFASLFGPSAANARDADLRVVLSIASTAPICVP